MKTRTRTLKAYSVHDGEPSECSILVFAYSAKDARKMGYQRLPFCANYIECQADRCESADHLIDSERVLDHENDDDRAIMRKAGWRVEEETACDKCGLYPMDDKRWALNEDGLCPECVHRHPDAEGER